MRTLISTLIILLLCTAALAQEPAQEPAVQSGDTPAAVAAPEGAATDEATETLPGEQPAPDEATETLPGEKPAPVEAVPAEPAEAPAPAEGAPEAAPAEAVQPEDSGPVGELHTSDGNIYEILALPRFGKFYLYLSGKLNGRTSTIISPTRMSDVKRWAGISFDGNNTITIITTAKKELQFTDAHLYIGSISADTFSFLITDPVNYDKVVKTVNKTDVKVIVFK